MKKVEGREIKKKKTKSTVTIKKCRKKNQRFYSGWNRADHAWVQS